MHNGCRRARTNISTQVAARLSATDDALLDGEKELEQSGAEDIISG